MFRISPNLPALTGSYTKPHSHTQEGGGGEGLGGGVPKTSITRTNADEGGEGGMGAGGGGVDTMGLPYTMLPGGAGGLEDVFGGSLPTNSFASANSSARTPTNSGVLDVIHTLTIHTPTEGVPSSVPSGVPSGVPNVRSLPQSPSPLGVFICMYMYLCIYVCICIRMYTCMHACMYTYTHTHTHTCRQPLSSSCSASSCEAEASFGGFCL
jgi:hypothetical protein